MTIRIFESYWLYYLNNGVFLLRNYQLIDALWKFVVLKTINYASLRTSNFQGATIRPIVLRLLSIQVFSPDGFYLKNKVFLPRNYRLTVVPRKFDVLKTNICPRSKASGANMLILRTSNFQGATIRLIVLRRKHSIVFIVHH